MRHTYSYVLIHLIHSTGGLKVFARHNYTHLRHHDIFIIDASIKAGTITRSAMPPSLCRSKWSAHLVGRGRPCPMGKNRGLLMLGQLFCFIEGGSRICHRLYHYLAFLQVVLVRRIVIA